MGDTQNKWVIVFLIYADFIDTENSNTLNISLLEELNELLKDISECPLDEEKCSIYVVYSNVNYEQKKGEEIVEIKNTTIIFKIEKGKEGKNNFKFFEKIDNERENKKLNDIGNYSVQKEEHLRKILVRIKNDRPEGFKEKILLTTWDHGAAFGIFNIEEHPEFLVSWPLLERIKFPFIIELRDIIAANVDMNFENEHDAGLVFVQDNQLFHSPQLQSNPKLLFNLLQSDNKSNPLNIIETNGEKFIQLNISGKSNYENDFKDFTLFSEAIPEKESRLSSAGLIDILTNEELAKAIRDSISKVDVLLMMNCWMMNIHTIYAVQESVEYLVAPQGLIAKPTYNFKTILAEINNQNPDPKSLVEIILTSAYDNNLPKREKENVDKWLIFAAKIDQPEIVKLKNTIKEFVSFVTKDLTIQITNLLYYTLRFSFVFTRKRDYAQIDILNWITALECFNLDKKSIQLIAELNNKFSSALLQFANATFISNIVFSDSVYKSIDKQVQTFTNNKPNGLSIYFPYFIAKEGIGYNLFTNFSSEETPCFAKDVPEWKTFIEIINKS